MRSEHEVIINIEIAVGVSPSQKPYNCYETTRDGQRKKIYEALPPDHTFHLEYNLLPGGVVFKTDVVTFGVVCKVHTDKDSRVIKAWEENGLVYHAWRHRHKIQVDHELLHALFDHTLQVRVWNTKSKLSPRARFDRPKAFRLPVPDPGESVAENTDSRPAKLPLVLHDQPRQSKAIPNHFPSKSSMAAPRMEPSQITPGMDCSLATPGVEPSLVSDMGEGSGEGTSQALLPCGEEDKPFNSTAGFTPVSPYALQSLPITTLTKVSEEQAEEARVEREGMATLSLPLAPLYGLSPTITSSLDQDIRDLKDMKVTVEVENTLMSDDQRRTLNPLCITVCQARGIPLVPSRTKSVTTEAANDSWEPIYVQYQLMGTNYRTSGREKVGATVTWNETKVTLLGTREQAHIIEYLRGPPVTVELHDRDRKTTATPSRSVFGKEKDDRVIGAQTYCRDKAGVPAYPYGIARLDLSELLLGQRLIEVWLPVLNCPKTFQEDVPHGDYLGSNTDLKIRVELAHPITLLPNSAHPLSTPRGSCCPFGRLVYVVSNTTGQGFVQAVLDRVDEVNGRAFGLDGLSRHLLKAALSTCKLTSDQISRSDCDVITGFQACDGEYHMLVLEGLAQGSLRDLWEGLERHSSQAPEIVRTFYNSEYTFSSRLYGALDVDITPIVVPRPLGELVGRAAFYAKENTPEPCLRGVVRLNDLKCAREMADIVRNSLLPTADEVVSLSMHFAAPLQREQLQLKDDEVPIEVISGQRPVTPRPGDRPLHKSCSRREPLELTNPLYEQLLAERKCTMATNFVHRNITHCQMLSLGVDKQKRHSRSLSEGTLASNEQVYNYSTQTLNSTEMSKARLRIQLSRDLKHRYTYSRNSFGATVAPFDINEVQKAEKLISESQWLTPSGFVYPGHTTSLESNRHPKTPDSSRVEELREVFQDRWLHTFPQNPVASRNRGDFDLYKRAPGLLGPALPVTIHLPGIQREEEVREKREKEEEKWRAKVVVDHLNLKVHRKPAFMEGEERGPRASTQLDKLRGLLKDPPLKRSLIVGGVPSEPNTCLRSVTCPPWCEVADGSRGGYHPGPLERSLKLDKNVIPVQASRFPETDHGAKVHPIQTSTERNLLSVR